MVSRVLHNSSQEWQYYTVADEIAGLDVAGLLILGQKNGAGLGVGMVTIGPSSMVQLRSLNVRLSLIHI